MGSDIPSEGNVRAMSHIAPIGEHSTLILARSLLPLVHRSIPFVLLSMWQLSPETHPMQAPQAGVRAQNCRLGQFPTTGDPASMPAEPHDGYCATLLR